MEQSAYRRAVAFGKANSMNGFQILAFLFLGTIFLRELARIAGGHSRATGGALRLAITVIAIVCIAQPNLTTAMARRLGIERGTDLVLYVFCLAFMATSLYFYARQAHLQSQLVEIVRHLAIREATPSGPTAVKTDDSASSASNCSQA